MSAYAFHSERQSGGYHRLHLSITDRDHAALCSLAKSRGLSLENLLRGLIGKAATAARWAEQPNNDTRSAYGAATNAAPHVGGMLDVKA